METIIGHVGRVNDFWREGRTTNDFLQMCNIIQSVWLQITFDVLQDIPTSYMETVSPKA